MKSAFFILLFTFLTASLRERFLPKIWNPNFKVKNLEVLVDPAKLILSLSLSF